MNAAEIECWKKELAELGEFHERPRQEPHLPLNLRRHIAAVQRARRLPPRDRPWGPFFSAY